MGGRHTLDDRIVVIEPFFDDVCAGVSTSAPTPKGEMPARRSTLFQVCWHQQAQDLRGMLLDKSASA